MTQLSGQARRVQRRAAHTTAFDFFNLLTAPELLEHLEARLPPHRERLFPPTETLSMFLSQALSADGSCRQVVDEAATARVLGDLPCCSTATSAYCQARQRVPLTLVRELTQITGALMRDTAEDRQGLWQGRRVRVVDGTTVTMADTAANQAAYPQQSNQKPGLGFPLSRVVAAFDLADGHVVDAAMGGYYGKGAHEQALLRQMLHRFERGDVILGDALYATYYLLAELQRRGMDAVFVQHGARQRVTDFRRGKRLGAQDHLIKLTKPKKPPAWMDIVTYDAMPDTLTVRELQAGGRILVTTLCDANACPKAALRDLYRRRWHAELNLRHLKTTLGMDALRCRTPAMAEKELWVYLLAYNLIRWVMRDSALLVDVLPEQISFKHALQMWRSWTLQVRPDEDLELRIEQLLRLIAQHRVGNRPDRIEPRAVKRRPKPYALLTTPRPEARRIVARYGHPNRKRGESLKPSPQSRGIR